VVLAVPVAPADAAARLGTDADAVIVVTSPRWFHAVGQVYADFRQVADHEVIELLERSMGMSGEPSEELGPR
jgi:putative phosphoribosyl transferase